MEPRRGAALLRPYALKYEKRSVQLRYLPGYDLKCKKRTVSGGISRGYGLKCKKRTRSPGIARIGLRPGRRRSLSEGDDGARWAVRLSKNHGLCRAWRRIVCSDKPSNSSTFAKETRRRGVHCMRPERCNPPPNRHISPHSTPDFCRRSCRRNPVSTVAIHAPEPENDPGMGRRAQEDSHSLGCWAQGFDPWGW